MLTLSRLLVVLLASIYVANALHFYLNTGESKCFFEDLPYGTFVVGKLNAEEVDPTTVEYSAPSYLKIAVTVDETFDSHRVVAQKITPNGEFTFTVLDDGEHKFCVTPVHDKGHGKKAKTRIFFDMAFDSTHTITGSKGKTDHHWLTDRVNEMNTKLELIQMEQFSIRGKEAQFRNTSEAVNAKILRYTVLQVLVLMATAGWQLRHLRRFFQKQKVV
ncbi:hypothetical protein BABINDRAFT_58067 [Babjeviella inositovora NRRL Y-12698]|uniref:GOLD domain-containing protein n=1 Tax=Babjeviella inositovora NRRL Y-12698 TaxID=984486 RepID=A0A1E3QWY0_9ASCO|nr:uncharacterized protein BABINDRAFT_58067 [Babjeviella inositovora NRRL Y-12698]ODQ81582.1 hypothetical protein BABINDRAFT_58067 [Babjeviella inositovora NRRL Y-12698]